MPLTLLLIIITVIISVIAFYSPKVMNDLIFYPPAIAQHNQYYRFISYGFLHADLSHLFFNMYAFYLFGGILEKVFILLFPGQGKLFFVLLYFLSLIASVIPDYFKHKNNQYYRSLGASGAVSAVVFAYIMVDPMQGIGLLFIPIYIPGFLFGILFLIISYFLGKKGGSSINHGAHIWGALFGVVFMIVAVKMFSSYPLLDQFIEKVKGLNLKNLFTTP